LFCRLYCSLISAINFKKYGGGAYHGIPGKATPRPKYARQHDDINFRMLAMVAKCKSTHHIIDIMNYPDDNQLGDYDKFTSTSI
jgi:hypothetical protein